MIKWTDGQELTVCGDWEGQDGTGGRLRVAGSGKEVAFLRLDL